MTTPLALLTISQKIESLLVQRNLRGMKNVQPALKVGYYLRASQQLMETNGCILIGTGFPVAGTFETDGPVGAIALYNCLKSLGKKPVLVCGEPLYSALQGDFECYAIPIDDIDNASSYTQKALKELQPELIISIERPGLSQQNCYYNIRGEDISENCATFDFFMSLANCPTIAIGDGGNEIGMGNIYEAIGELDIVPCVTRCDELLIADVSNWGAYGLIAFVSLWRNQNLLADIKPKNILAYLSKLGSVDGLTRKNELTEDGLCFSCGEDIIFQLQKICGLEPNNL
ncbi:MAG: DUF4392 domain-containing protein [Paraglaciecola sp.]|uniref:DUF4392 domain-containing protein n=1 Tax=Paraglaciecola sp. TaxID=1920173 RepID=UPI0032987F16